MNRKMIAGALTALLLLSSVVFGAEPPDLTLPGAVPIAKITGTTVVLLGISQSQGDVVRLESVPREALNYCQRRQLNGKDVLEFYWPGHPTVEFLVFAATGAQAEVARFVVLADGEEPPDPPDPPDPPLPPGQKWRVAIVFERTELDNLPKGQQQLISSLTFRDKLKAAGHLLVPGGVVDQHTVDADGNVPVDLAPYLDAVEGDPLPRICLEPIDGGEVLDFSLPVGEAEVFELLEKGSE